MKIRDKCIEVYDGDTFLTKNGVWIRLTGVYCPEVGVYGSKKATAILSKKILNRTITYEPVGKSYHRVLAKVWLYGKSINNYMRRLGYK